jgi:hypothetical protein
VQRRSFITLFAGVILVPRAACAQQLGIPVIGYLSPQTAEAGAGGVVAFREGLQGIGFVDGRNVTIEYTGGTTNMIDFRRWRPISPRAK